MTTLQKYYLSQARSGVSGFRGAKHLKGGSVLSELVRFGSPILKFLGKSLGRAGLGIATDFLEGDMSKDSLKKAAKTHMRQGARNVVNYTASRMNGSGRRRRRRRHRAPGKQIKRRKVGRKKSVRRRRSTTATHRGFPF